MCAGSCALCESWTHLLLQQPAIAPLSTSAFHRHTHPLLLSDCSMLVLSVILRNLCSSAPNYTGSLNFQPIVRKKASKWTEGPHPGPPGVLLEPHLAVASFHKKNVTSETSQCWSWSWSGLKPLSWSFLMLWSVGLAFKCLVFKCGY